MNMILRFGFSAAIAAFVIVVPPVVAAEGYQAFAPILSASHRDEAARQRDAYRHPAQTLGFFGIQPDMTVIEIWPGGGWYMDILAPYLKDSGRYIAADFGLEPTGPFADFMRNSNTRLAEKAANRDLYGEVTLTHLAPPDEIDLAEPGSVDMVLTFRNLHNWLMWGGARSALTGIYAALKPGGVFGVIDHRADPTLEIDPNSKNGYVNEQRAIELIESVGFKLIARSEINANPADTKDYPFGVWTLPPTLRKGDEERDRYLAIGESDRFTLRFVKPE